MAALEGLPLNASKYQCRACHLDIALAVDVVEFGPNFLVFKKVVNIALADTKEPIIPFSCKNLACYTDLGVKELINQVLITVNLTPVFHLDVATPKWEKYKISLDKLVLHAGDSQSNVGDPGVAGEAVGDHGEAASNQMG